MRLLAILLPPLAMLLVGRPLQATACLLLMVTVIGWPVAALWAWGAVSDAYADRRTSRIVRAAQKS